MAKDITVRVNGQNPDGSVNISMPDGASNPFMQAGGASSAMVPYTPSPLAQNVGYRARIGNVEPGSPAAVAGLRLLLDRESAFDDWLRTDVAAAYDKLKSDPSRAVGTDVVRSRLAGRRKRIQVRR